MDKSNALVSILDLSDIEFEVRGWKSEYKNNIKTLSEIIGLINLKNLCILNLENNEIEDLKELTNLKNITHLYLSNNKIANMKNIEYLKQIPHLQYLRIKGNKISDYIDNEDFNPDIKIIKKIEIF